MLFCFYRLLDGGWVACIHRLVSVRGGWMAVISHVTRYLENDVVVDGSDKPSEV
jgi:hypothetical protein